MDGRSDWPRGALKAVVIDDATEYSTPICSHGLSHALNLYLYKYSY